MIIKQKPEDFIVREILDLEIKEGPYSYYKLWKKDMDQMKAIEIVSKLTRTKSKLINFAGTKDKRAITEQYISIPNGKKIDYIGEDIKIKYIGKGKERISLGQLEANEFEITVREVKKFTKKDFIINYFDDQRFGINKNNHIIGKLLIKKDFKKAAELIQHKTVKQHLENKPTDYIGAIRTLPKKIMTMYTHAYQSYIFNELCKEEVKKHKHYEVKYNIGKLLFPNKKIKNKKIPIIGFDTEEDVSKILKKEGLTLRDFIIRQIPGLSCSGNTRDLIANIDDLEIKQNNKLKFRLPKGSYATIAIKVMCE